MTPTDPQLGYAGDKTPQQAWDVLVNHPNAQLIDVRTRAEWSFVGVPMAASPDQDVLFVEWVTYPDGQPNPLFVAQVSQQVADHDVPVLCICRSGARSKSAAQALTAAGFTDVYNVAEGFEGTLDAQLHRGDGGWKSNGLPWKQG